MKFYSIDGIAAAVRKVGISNPLVSRSLKI